MGQHVISWKKISFSRNPSLIPLLCDAERWQQWFPLRRSIWRQCPWLTLICSHGCSPAAFLLKWMLWTRWKCLVHGQLDHPSLIHACPAPQRTCWPGLLERKWILHLLLCHRIKPYYMCMYSSFSPHLPAEHHFKHVNGSRSNPPASCV